MKVEHQGQKTKILVVGGGGHAKVVLDALRCNSYEIVGILEADVHLVGTDVCGIPVIGTDADAWRFFQEGVTHAVVAIGHLGNYSVRKKCIQRLLEIGFELDTIIHKSAVVSPYAQLQQGTVVLAGAIINAGARVGAHCIINTGAIVEHDVVLGENVHVAPKAAISGGSTVGDNCLIGMGSSVIQGRTIGDDCVVGAGSVVIRDIPDRTTVVGVPAKVIRGGGTCRYM